MGRSKHPFGISVAILVIAYVVIKWGIAYVPPLLGINSAPVPASVVLQYMVTVLVGVLLWVSDNEDRWRTFKQPIHHVMVSPDRKVLRILLLIAIPSLVAFVTYDRVRQGVAAPPSLRSIHPAPPGSITFRGQTMELAGLENPLRQQGDLQEHYERGKEIYVRNCLPCHGDGLNGQGYFAHGFNPAPLNFQDNGTIAQLTESFVFWRIAKGGPGLPREGTPWNSAMPAWEDFLTADEIWSVIIFLYEQTGWTPRTWEEAGEGEEH